MAETLDLEKEALALGSDGARLKRPLQWCEYSHVVGADATLDYHGDCAECLQEGRGREYFPYE